ncbi:MAG: response regulator transcription factor [Acidobacteria bacterium]|nr:response regulator transcription factor [Acidobacteriota bacterium]
MSNSPTNTIRILLVDDHWSVMEGLEKLINGERPLMEVVGQASTPEDAVQKARELRPDLVLLDIDLGVDQQGKDISGVNLLPELLREGAAQVLMLTGIRDPEKQTQCIRNGARGVVNKLEKGATILTAIEKVHGGKRWHSEVDEVIMEAALHEKKGGTESEGGEIKVTPKEREVIAFVTTSENLQLTNEQLAGLMNMSRHTLKNHFTSIHDKLDTKNRYDLFLYVTKHGLPPSD